MLRERRKSKRLDICIIIEYKALQSSMSSLGITRDFTSNGFSFESQDFDVEPGENLDFKFKNSESNVYVSAAGAIVWKKRNSEFGYLIGIQFNEIDDETRQHIYEAVSATGHVPLNYLVFDSSGEGPYHEESGSDLDDYASMYYDAADSHETVDKKLLTEDIGSPEPSISEDQMLPDVKNNKNEELGTGKKQVPFVHTYPVKTNRRKKKPLYSPIVKIIILLLLLLAAILFFGEQDKVLESHTVQVLEEPVIVEEIEAIQPAEPAIINAELSAAPFLIQVGAWRNSEYSDEILPRVQERYPDAYIVVENNFNIIRIPGVMTIEEGGIMLNEIADEFNLTGLVITNK